MAEILRANLPTVLVSNADVAHEALNYVHHSDLQEATSTVGNSVQLKAGVVHKAVNAKEALVDHIVDAAENLVELKVGAVHKVLDTKGLVTEKIVDTAGSLVTLKANAVHSVLERSGAIAVPLVPRVVVAVKSSKGSIQGWQPVAKNKHVVRHLKKLKDESERQMYLAEHAEGHWVYFSDDALNQPLVMQMGLAKDYADFEAFMADVLDNPFRWRSDTEFEYTGCGDAGTIVWNTSSRYLPTINSVPVNIYPARVYDSHYLKSYYNSGEVQIQDTNGRTLKLDFNEKQSK